MAVANMNEAIPVVVEVDEEVTGAHAPRALRTNELAELGDKIERLTESVDRLCKLLKSAVVVPGPRARRRK